MNQHILNDVERIRSRHLARKAAREFGAEVLFNKDNAATVISFRNEYDGGPGSGNFGHEGRPGEVGGSAATHNFGGMKNGELSAQMKSVFSESKTGTHFSVKMNGAGGKDALEIYKVSDGFYIQHKNGSNSIVESADKVIESCGVYVNERTKNTVMYKGVDIEVGDPETEQAKKFANDYDAYKKTKERLATGNFEITTVDDATAKKYADTLNNASKGKIAKLASEDPQFKAVVDNISAYTQGEYVYQRQVAEKVAEGEYSPSEDSILGDRLTGSPYLCKDMYKGQNLSVSSASVAEGMKNLTKAVDNSEPFDGELYRVAQDRGLMKTAASGAQRVYIPPTVGDTIHIAAPTSFSKDQEAVNKIANDKSGDIIYYTVEPGAHAVDVAKLSPYKQAELLSCGDYEVVNVSSVKRTVVRQSVEHLTKDVVESLKNHRSASVEDGTVTFPLLETHIVLRQKSPIKTDSKDIRKFCYRPDDFSERMVITETVEH